MAVASVGGSIAPFGLDRRNFWSTPAGQAAGTDPYASLAAQIAGYTQAPGFNPMTGGWVANGSGGALSGAHVARPQDQEVQDYLAGTVSQQKQATNDYVRRAATAGIQRGGMNVAGGPALDTALHQQAINSLAQGAASRFNQAMDYNKYYQSTIQQQQQQQADNAMRLLNLQNQVAAQQAAQNQAIWQAQREDFGADTAAGSSWVMNAPQRQQAQQQAFNQQQADRYAQDQNIANQQAQRNLYFGMPAQATRHASPADATTALNEYLRAIGGRR